MNKDWVLSVIIVFMTISIYYSIFKKLKPLWRNYSNNKKILLLLCYLLSLICTILTIVNIIGFS